MSHREVSWPHSPPRASQPVWAEALVNSQIRSHVQPAAGTGSGCLVVSGDKMLHTVGLCHLDHICLIPNALSTGKGLGAPLLLPLPFPKHLVNCCWIFPTSGTILELNVKAPSGQKVEQFLLSILLFPVSGDAASSGGSVWTWHTGFGALPTASKNGSF